MKYKIISETNAQGSAEMILLIGILLVIILFVGTYTVDIIKSISDTISTTMKNFRDISINKL
ncbi:MAG: class III signal peptide-containing protein [Methanobacteriaceae archaeon]